MIIVGAGLSGLIAASMLRDEVNAIYEVQPALPNNHSALLRFRSNAVADATGVPFKKVSVLKGVHGWSNAVADAVAYSNKCTGQLLSRSITSSEFISERYISPPDFITRLAAQVMDKIQLGKTLSEALEQGEPIISTIPMPALMGELDWDDRPDFKGISGEVISCEVDNCDLYATIYVPSPHMAFYRASITGNKLIIEFSAFNPVTQSKDPEDQEEHIFGSFIIPALSLFGVGYRDVTNIQHHKQKYAKILPVEERLRKSFIIHATDQHNIYSLGRFATWRPGLLLDDIVNDVRMIQQMEAGNLNSRYGARLS